MCYNLSDCKRVQNCADRVHCKHSPKIELIKGDITQLKVDAIVNAANNSLLGGGGVDGAIHMKAGHELIEECIKLNGCETGEAKITRGYGLPAKFVIHTVGPVYSRQEAEQAKKLLTDCYQNCFKLAKLNNVRTIAFPAISCGVYGYPMGDACKIALNTAVDILKEQFDIKKVIFILFSERALNIYKTYFKTMCFQAQ